MRLVYTHRGFPTAMDVTSGVESIYESPAISDIYRRRMEQNRPDVALELVQIATMTKEWQATRGFFVPSLSPSVRISGAVASFIGETALYLTKQITRRRVSFQDRGLMIKADALVDARLPNFSKEERAAIEELSFLSTEEIIQMWVVNLGVDDLSQTLQLYVGDRSNAAAS